MSLTRVTPAIIAVTNNITSNTFGSANTIPSFQVDGSGVIVAASNTAITLTANSVANNQFQTGSIENYMRAQGSASVFAGMRNRIINGAMTIDQRNAGASTTPSDGNFLCDRWKVGLTQSAKFSGHTQASIVPPNYGNALKIVSNSAYSVTSSDEFSLFQNIEGYNVDDLGFGAAGAKTVTLSFWVRSSLTGTFGGCLKNAIAARSYTFPYTIVAADTWEYKTITIPGDTTGSYTRNSNANSLQLFFSLGQGSNGLGTANTWQAADLRGVTGQVNLVGTNNATWYLSGVQLEAGSQATPFEFRHYTTELQLCQRYFFLAAQDTTKPIGMAAFTSGGDMRSVIAFPITMRTTPSLSVATGTGYYRIYSGSYNSAFDSFASDLPGTTMYGVGSASGLSGVSAGVAGIFLTNNAGAKISFSAEF